MQEDRNQSPFKSRFTKLQAIKQMRDWFQKNRGCSLGLRDAKNVVEYLQEQGIMQCEAYIPMQQSAYDDDYVSRYREPTEVDILRARVATLEQMNKAGFDRITAQENKIATLIDTINSRNKTIARLKEVVQAIIAIES